MSNHSVKFHKDLISSFRVILQIDKLTDGHGWIHDLLGEVIIRHTQVNTQAD